MPNRSVTRVCAAAILIAAMAAPGFVRAAPADEVRTLFENFVAAQNAHDLPAVGNLLSDSPDFLWITRGTAIWGRDAALRRFEALYKGTWRLDPAMSRFRAIELGNEAVQLLVPVTFMIAPAGQAAPPQQFLMNQTVVKTAQGWRIVSILPIPVPVPPQQKAH